MQMPLTHIKDTGLNIEEHENEIFLLRPDEYVGWKWAWEHMHIGEVIVSSRRHPTVSIELTMFCAPVAEANCWRWRMRVALV